MKNIRQGIFETNSSATHALTLTNKNLLPSTLKIDKNGYVVITLSEFEDYGEVKTQDEKLAWLILQGQSEANVWFYSYEYENAKLKDIYDEYYDSVVFDEIEKAIISYCGAKGLRFKRGTHGHINHQNMDSLHEFLDEINCTIQEFVFGDMYLTLGRD